MRRMLLVVMACLSAVLLNCIVSYANEEKEYIDISGTDHGDWTIKGYDDDLTLEVSVTGTLQFLTVGEDPWYAYRNRITKVIINKGCTGLGHTLFYGWSALKEVSLPQGLLTIGYDVFRDCVALKTINLPGSLTTLEGDVIITQSGIVYGQVFGGCTSLEHITIPARVKALPVYCFCNCTKLSTVEFAERSELWTAGDGAFSGCTALSDVDLSKCKEIGSSCFSGCSQLKSVDLSKCSKIAKNAFLDCVELTEIKIGDCPTIGNNAFSGCVSQKKLTIQGTINSGTGSISDTAFSIQVYNDPTDPAYIYITDGTAWENSRICSYFEPYIGDGTLIVRNVGYDITLAENTIVVQADNSSRIQYSIHAEGAGETGTLLFESTDPETAIVDHDGNVSGKKVGETDILIKAENGMQKSSVHVIVVGENDPVGLMFNDDSVEIGQNQTTSMPTVQCDPVNASHENIVFESSDPDVLQVNADGSITGVSVGRATLYAKAGPCKASCSVNVVYIHAAGISISDETLELVPGTEYQLSVVVFPENATDRTLNWTCSNSAVAEIDDNGTITTKKDGKVTITAATNDGGFTACCEVTVIRPAVHLTISEDSLYVGQSIKIDQSVTPAFSGYQGSWSSSDSHVAVVDTDGKVTAVGIGTATVKYTISYAEESLKETAACTIKVVGMPLDDATITGIPDQVYSGEALTPVPETVKLDNKRLVNGKDYELSYKNNVNAGTATLIVSGIGIYTGSAQASFTIDKAEPKLSLKYEKVSVDNVAGIRFSPSVSGAYGQVTYSSSDSSIGIVGRASGDLVMNKLGTVIITAQVAESANYHAGVTDCVVSAGAEVQPLVIEPKSIKLGYGQKTEIVVSGAKGIITYKSSDSAIAKVNGTTGVVSAAGVGHTTVTVVASANGFYGETKKTIDVEVIKAKQVISIKTEKNTITIGKTTAVTATGAQGNVTYASSDTTIATVNKTTGVVTGKKAGVVTITVTAAATANFNKAVKTITIKVIPVEQAITVKAKTSYVAVGKTDPITVTGNQGKVTYKSADTAIATVSSKGVVTGKKVGTVRITITAAATAVYKKATKTITIKVRPAATASVSTTKLSDGIQVTWKKVTGATGYYVYRNGTQIKKITSGNTLKYKDTEAKTNGTKYVYKIVAYAGTGKSPLSKSVTTYYVSRPAIAAATAGTKQMTIRWKKNAKATGYQIQYSVTSDFSSGNKNVTVSGADNVEKVIRSLTTGKTYYVRLRTIKTVSDVKYYSAWSVKKTVKVK